MDKVIYGCVDHIEELLDTFLDENEEMPVMEEMSVGEVGCHECKEMAIYKLTGSEVKAKWE